MDTEKWIKKKRKQIMDVEKIKDDRKILSQNVGWLFRPLALCPFPANALGKRTVIDENGEYEEYKILWKRRSYNIEVEILGHPEYGVPYGQDVLIILYLAYLAVIQKSRKIKVNFYRDYMNFWGMNPKSGYKYQLVIDSLKRVRNSKYKITDENEVIMNKNKEKEIHYLYIKNLDLICLPKKPAAPPSVEDQYIVLSESFYEEIKEYRIPFNIDAVRILKSRPAYLNFYIWLGFRVAQLNKKRIELEQKKIDLFIPYWGEYGLINQLSTQIKRKPDFRLRVKRWLDATKELWPLCPVKIKEDGLYFEVESDKQLDVQIDPQKEIGRAIRKAIEAKKEDQKPCPRCGETLQYREGKEIEGKKLKDYLRCQKCNKNYSRKLNPELFNKG